MSRAAAWPSESHTAPQKRVQSHKVSVSLMVAWCAESDSDLSSFGGGSVTGRGEDDTMERDSARV